MMKTKFVKTVVALVTENMTAQSSATSLLTSFVVFVAARATWPGIVLSIKILTLKQFLSMAPHRLLTGQDSILNMPA